MTGLCAAAEAAKQFILNGDWTQQPMHIVFYANNSAAISHIYKGTPGKAQDQSLAFRGHIKEILNEVQEALLAISWVPSHSKKSLATRKQTDVDARICWLGNPKKALPIYGSRLQNEANHKCIAGVE